MSCRYVWCRAHHTTSEDTPVIRNILDLAPWWFWVFLAPELLMGALWLVFAIPFAVITGSVELVTRWRGKAQ
jgi:hypothetical protein